MLSQVEVREDESTPTNQAVIDTSLRLLAHTSYAFGVVLTNPETNVDQANNHWWAAGAPRNPTRRERRGRSECHENGDGAAVVQRPFRRCPTRYGVVQGSRLGLEISVSTSGTV